MNDTEPTQEELDAAGVEIDAPQPDDPTYAPPGPKPPKPPKPPAPPVPTPPADPV